MGLATWNRNRALAAAEQKRPAAARPPAQTSERALREENARLHDALAGAQRRIVELGAELEAATAPAKPEPDKRRGGR